MVSLRCLKVVSAVGSPLMDGSSRAPKLKVGLLSDIQYANADDVVLHTGSRRHHRHALTSVEQAVSSWTVKKVQCAVNLGDVIDAYNMVTDSSEQALQAVLDIFKKLPDSVDMRHVLGNHCVCHPLERQRLLELLGMNGDPATERGYYAFTPVDGWKMIVLDGCDISTYAWNKEHTNFQEAYKILNIHSDIKLLPDKSNYKKLLKAKKKETIKESDYVHNLEGLNQRFVFYNGAVGEEQLEWFRKELDDAEAAEQNVLVFCHMPLLPGICRPGMLLWNYDDVLDAMHAQGDLVKGVFCGHAHQYGYKRDGKGIPHMVLPAVLETSPGAEGHGVIEAYQDKLIVNGFSRPEMIWDFEAQRRKMRKTPDQLATQATV